MSKVNFKWFLVKCLISFLIYMCIIFLAYQISKYTFNIGHKIIQSQAIRVDYYSI